MLFTILITLYVVICVALIVVILLQSGKGSGLSGIFGSGGGGQTIFGARAGDVMTKTTTILAICFMGFSLVLALISAREDSLVGEIEAAGLEMPRTEADPAAVEVELPPVEVEEEPAPVPPGGE